MRELTGPASLISCSGPGATEVEPPGCAYARRTYVSRRAQEQRALGHLATPGMPVVLWGPALFGKSQTLQHLLIQLRSEPETRIVAVDLRHFDSSAWSGPEPFFRELATRIAQACGVSDEFLAAILESRRALPLRMGQLMERLLQTPAQLVLALDHADVICERVANGDPLVDTFFGMLRAWINRSRLDGPWAKLRLLMAIASSPAYLIRSVHQSPFNLTECICLEELDAEQVRELATVHGLSATAETLHALGRWIGGHPYLHRLLFYQAVRSAISLEQLVQERAPTKLFEDHLHLLRERLKRAGLYDSLLRVCRDQQPELSGVQFDELQRIGVLSVCFEGARPIHRLRYPIYEFMFQHEI